MKEKDGGREPNLREKALILWQNLEEVEDLYLKDFPDAKPLVYVFGKVKVSINFATYQGNRECGIAAISISEQREDYSESREDIIIRKRSTGRIESTVGEDDSDNYTNFFPDGKRRPTILPVLSQPISYYEKLLNDRKRKPNASYRNLEHADIDKALNYLDQIYTLLAYNDFHEHP